MRCPACKEDNLSTNLFCSKCATSLGKEQAKAQRKSQVYLPPQSEVAKPAAAPVRVKSRLIALIGIALLCIVLVIFVSRLDG